jgi:hypothetical protein
MAKNRGLYGQTEGNEHNPNGFNEHLADNNVAEGECVARLKRARKNGGLQKMALVHAAIQREGHSEARADAMLRQAMHGMRI